MCHRKIGLWEAVSIGIGGMVGGGIFAVLGLSVQLSRGAAPLAFLLAGLVALSTAYSYAKLSVRFPSEGGTIEYLVRGYGSNLLSGSLNVLLLLSYTVMVALYAYAFGSYGANVLGGSALWKHGLATAVVLGFMGVNALGAYVSGKAEDLMVAFKLLVLLLVAGTGVLFIRWQQLAPAQWPGAVNIVAGGMLIFLAYEGFELIANTAQDVEHPEILPRAFYLSVLTVIAVYVLIAVVTVGTLPVERIVQERDYALASVARPILGAVGFWLVTLAALVSTSSAINATLYGTARASYMVAKYGQLPQALEKRVWKEAVEGLFLIGLAAILLANTASLEEISTAGSGGFLLVFFAVNLAAFRLRRSIKASTSIVLLGMFTTLVALALLLYRMMSLSPRSLAIFGLLMGLAVALEGAYRLLTGRELQHYIDDRLRQREENLRNWHRWISPVLARILQHYRDAEVYLVGSLARKQLHQTHDVDLLVVTAHPPAKNQEAQVAEELTQDLTRQHPVHFHFVPRAEKQGALHRARAYQKLATGPEAPVEGPDSP